MSVATISTRRVLVKAWLPNPWNSRLLSSGGGGIGGCVDYNGLHYGDLLEFASFGTKGGHSGSVGYDFFLYQPEVINDFGYRSITLKQRCESNLCNNITDNLLSTITMPAVAREDGKISRRRQCTPAISMPFRQALLE